jgi:hypothetical protein
MQPSYKHIASRVLTFSLDALKCIAWGGRALVVGFAGGAIEQVHLLAGGSVQKETLTRRPSLFLVIHDTPSAPAQPRPSQERFRRRHLLGLVHMCVLRTCADHANADLSFIHS